MAEVLLEFYVVGDSVRVAAIDARTGFEVSIVGPANAGRHALSRLAVRKLRFMQRRQENSVPPAASGHLV